MVTALSHGLKLIWSIHDDSVTGRNALPDGCERGMGRERCGEREANRQTGRQADSLRQTDGAAK